MADQVLRFRFMFDNDLLKEKILARPERVPAHVAIIMDGNGRWAALRNKPRTAGHEAGVKAVREVVRACSDLGIKYLTLYTFSVQNWKRPVDEVAALMSLLVRTTLGEIKDLMSNSIRLRTIGRPGGLSKTQQGVIDKAIKLTENNDGLVLTLALNYGGRAEIIDAVKTMTKAARAGLLDVNNVSEELFSEFLYTAGTPDPDLMIRTSGEQRISNFLLWQTSYTELTIIDTLWPDFGKRELFDAVLDYQGRERRFGKLVDQEES
ncbi:MAG: isoprenyl transferase [candidate division Zixibacteria bacterium]